MQDVGVAFACLNVCKTVCIDTHTQEVGEHMSNFLIFPQVVKQTDS